MNKKSSKILISSIIIFGVCALFLVLSIYTLYTFFSDMESYVNNIATQADEILKGLSTEIIDALGEDFVNQYRSSYIKSALTTSIGCSFVIIPLSLFLIFFNIKTIKVANASCFELMQSKKSVLTTIILTIIVYGIGTKIISLSCILLLPIIFLILEFQNAGKQVVYFTKLKEKEEMEKEQKEKQEQIDEEPIDVSDTDTKIKNAEEMDKIYEQLALLEKSFKNNEISFTEYNERKEKILNQ